MEGIAVIILLIGLISSLSKAAKQNKNRPGQGQAKKPGASPTPRPAAPQPAKPAEPAKPPVFQELLQELVGQTEEKKAPAEDGGFAEAFSFEDDKGCVGGSLPHEADELHEGESTDLPIPTPLRPLARAEETAAEASAPRVTRRVSAADLRQAVIMSEILGRPRALRSRAAR